MKSHLHSFRDLLQNSLYGIIDGFVGVALLGRVYECYLKMLSAILVAIFLAAPYLKKKYFSKQKIFEDANHAEEKEDAENA